MKENNNCALQKILLFLFLNVKLNVEYIWISKKELEKVLKLDFHWVRFCGVGLNTMVLRLTSQYLNALELKWERKALSLNVLR